MSGRLSVSTVEGAALPGNPAAVSAPNFAPGGFRPVALRPTLSDGLPFSSTTIC